MRAGVRTLGRESGEGGTSGWLPGDGKRIMARSFRLAARRGLVVA